MSSRTIARSVLQIAPLVLLSRGAGFLLIAIIAYLFGAQTGTDAFFLAFAIAVVLQFIVASGVATVATPVMASLNREAPHQLADHCSSLSIVTAVLAAGVAFVAYLGLDPILTRFELLPPDVRPVAHWYALCMVPYVGLSTANAVFKAATEIHGRFTWAAFAPFARTATAIVIVLLGQEALSTRVLPLAYVIGAVCELILYVGMLSHLDSPVRLRVRLNPAVRQTLRKAAPVLIGQSLLALIPLVDRLFASSLDPGAVSTLDYADRVRWVPQQFVEFTLIPVAFATWSHGVARGDHQAYATQLRSASRWVIALAPPALLGLYLQRYLLIRLLFERGAFTSADSAMCADVLSGYLIGLTFAMLGGLAVRAHIIEGRLLWVMAMGGLSLLVKIGANVALIGLGLMGLSLASSVVWLLVRSAHLWRLRVTLKGHPIRLR